MSDPFLNFEFTLPTRLPGTPSFVSLDFNFLHHVGRSQKVQSRKETICLLFEPGSTDDDARASLTPVFEALGCSWVDAQPGMRWRGLFMRPGRILSTGKADVPAERHRTHLGAQEAIQERARTIAAHLAQAPRVELARWLDSNAPSFLDMDGLASAFEGLMTERAALEFKKTLAAQTPIPAPTHPKPRL